MPIVATAGHVDHGKSSLVLALTGTDPDRWAEEKARGLTIDLGFAWTDIGGHDVGFVDVPGHERFIKNMLAGVGAVDCALLVVAADEGWMPQSEEHAAVLDLLEVPRGLIACTRIDLVDADVRELAELDIHEHIDGTSLSAWPIIGTSTRTGEGLDAIRSSIAAILDTRPPSRPAPFRMWVDRSFTVPGAGQVVTGTVMAGALTVGDDIEARPGGRRLRVRGIEHHDEAVSTVRTGDRAALNVSGPGDDDLGRGDLLVEPGTALDADRAVLALRPTRTVEAIPERGAFHVHIGSASRPAGLRAIGEGAWILRLEDPVGMAVGDHVVVRDAGRRAVVGGGRVLDPLAHVGAPDAEAIRLLVEALAGDADTRADALVTVHGSVPISSVRAATAGGVPSLATIAGERYVSADEVGRVIDLIRPMAATYHRDHPSRPGIPKAQLATTLGVPVEVVERAIEDAEDLEEDAGSVRSVGFRSGLDDEAAATWKRVRSELEASLDVPRLQATGLDPELVAFLVRSGDLVRIDDDLVFTSAQVDGIVAGLGDLPDGFTVAEFRDHFGMTRRQAVPTLEWLDATGRTRRSGDGRTVRGT